MPAASRSASTGSKFTSASATRKPRHVHRDHHRHRHRPQRRGARRPAAGDRLRLRSVDRRSRRVDRLLGRVPDGGRQGRGLVRGRCQPRNRSRAPCRACGTKARASISSGRCASATSSAGISSPAMSMRSATVVEAHADGGSTRLTLAAPAAIGKGIAAKGSIALDGVSLTVNSVEDAGDETRFTVNLIPHTARSDHARRNRGRATAQCRNRHPRPLSRTDDGAIITVT